MNRGEVWWAEHPEAGRRPVLILTRQAAIPVLQTLLVAPATRTIRGIPTEVVLTREDGMPDECALTLDNVSVMPRGYLTGRICRLRGDQMVEVCSALAIATGCA